jgi:hypothetical protein
MIDLIKDKFETDENAYFSIKNKCNVIISTIINLHLSNILSNEVMDFVIDSLITKYTDDTQDVVEYLCKINEIHNYEDVETFLRNLLKDNKLQARYRFMIEDLNKKPTRLGGNINYRKIRYPPSLFTEENISGGRIHSLLMGGGKTSMVTPLTVLRSFHILNANNNVNNEAIYLILPEQLVRQSCDNLTQYLTNYFPIKVTAIKEDRKDKFEYCEAIDNIVKNTLHNNLYIMSDVTMKCGFINDSISKNNKISANKNKNLYIFDEVDTILNPLVSELNYPDGTAGSFEEFNSFYEIIFECINNLFPKSKTYIPEFALILDDPLNKSKYTLSPHLSIFDDSLIPLFTACIKDKIINYFKDNSF